jgi:hypothetical protein
VVVPSRAEKTAVNPQTIKLLTMPVDRSAVVQIFE